MEQVSNVDMQAMKGLDMKKYLDLYRERGRVASHGSEDDPGVSMPVTEVIVLES